jgi:hypothetical protein
MLPPVADSITFDYVRPKLMPRVLTDDDKERLINEVGAVQNGIAQSAGQRIQPAHPAPGSSS